MVWFPAVREIAEAVRGRRFEVAAELSEQLEIQIAAVRGLNHPEALRALEVRGHVAFAAGDFPVAVDLYLRVAAEWRRLGATAAGDLMIRNAGVCHRRATAACIATGAGRRRPRRGARRLSVLVVAVSALLSAGYVELRTEHRPGSAGPSVELAAAPLIAGLRNAPVQAAAPSSVPPDQPAPSADDGVDDSAAGQDDTAARPEATRPVRHRPSGPKGAAADSKVEPQKTAAAGVDAARDVCEAANRYGRVPDAVVAMCRRLYGGGGVGRG